MKKLSLLLLTTSLSACAVGPDYQAPHVDFADTWNFTDASQLGLKIKPAGSDVAPASQTETTPLPAADEVYTKAEWWENFNDPVLNQLIAEAVKSNYDLKTAQSRVKQARANRLSAFAVLLPKVDAQGNAARLKAPGFYNSEPLSIYQADFDASWEVDVFGGNRRKHEAAEDQVQGAKADLKNALISLRAEVARNYIEVRNFQNQINITEDNIKSQQESLKLTTSQRDAGLVSDLDVSQADSLFYTTKSRLPALQTSLEQAKNNLSVLLGQQPGKLDNVLSAAQPVPVADKKFLVETPADIIAKRPDVASAERNLAAATAMQGAAIADYFPKLSVTSMFGYAHAADLLAPGATWALLGSASLPIIDFGKVRAEVRAADAEQEQAFDNFQKTVLVALSEVQNNLSAYANEESRREALAHAVATNRKAVDLSKARYDKGIAAFTDVLLAQREMYDVQSQLAQSDANVAEDLIALNKSLGR